MVYVFPIILFIAVAFYISTNLIHVSRVRRYSTFYISVKGINNRYTPYFRAIQNIYHVNYNCNTLQQLKTRNNRDSVLNYLCGVYKTRESSLGGVFDIIERNRINLSYYLYEYGVIESSLAGSSYTATKGHTWLSENRYKRLESHMCSKIKLKPCTTAIIICNLSYTSKKGKKHYSTQWKIDMSEVVDRIKKRTEAELSIDHQRSLMTSSKRYDIMKRDGFRCMLCGRTANDGVKLEVDHIIPVSKGGKSIDSNLRTLCYECNQGKKAKLP